VSLYDAFTLFGRKAAHYDTQPSPAVKIIAVPMKRLNGALNTPYCLTRIFLNIGQPTIQVSSNYRNKMKFEYI